MLVAEASKPRMILATIRAKDCIDAIYRVLALGVPAWGTAFANRSTYFDQSNSVPAITKPLVNDAAGLDHHAHILGCREAANR